MKRLVKKKTNGWRRFAFGALALSLVFNTFLSLVGTRFVCESDGYLGTRFDELADLSPFWYSKANFDGYHYLTIARADYGLYQEAFFPLYPRLIRGLTFLTGSYLASGLLISGLSLVGAVYFLGRLMEEKREKPAVIRLTILSLLFFPASFFFYSAYPESLFLFLIVLAFYFAARKRWLEAGLIGALVSYSRAVGIFIWPALLVEYLAHRSQAGRREFRNSLISGIKKPGHFWDYLKKTERKFYHLKNTIYISLSSLGLVAYGLELLRKKGGFFYFINTQSQLGGEGSASKLILIYQVVWRYLKMFILVEKNILRYYTIWLEFLVAALVGLMLLLGFVKKYRLSKSHLVFGWLAFIIPTLTGSFLSMPRFSLVIFPFFWILGKLLAEKRKLALVYFSLSVSVLAIVTILFMKGYWIS